MNKPYTLFILAAMVLIVTFTTVSAQSTTDTVFIPGSQSLQISDIINADTVVTTHRVYVLDRGAIYYIDRAFEINRSCKFIAQGDTSLRPPVIAPAIRADDTSEEWYFKLIQTGINVELNDLYLLSMRSDGQTLGWSRAIHIGANNISLKLRRVVFDAWTEAGIRVDGANFVKLDVQDCHFRNLIHSTAYFGGQPFLSGGGPDHPDTTIFKNNTFFACNSYIFTVRGLGPYNLFEHNTIVYGAVNPFITRQAENLYLNNNIMYAAHAWGGDPEQVIGSWFFNYPDTISSGLLQIRREMTYNGYETIGPEAFNDTALGLIFDPNQWTFVAENNAYFFTDELEQFYSDWNDTVSVFDSVEVITGPKQYLKRTLSMPVWINGLGEEVLNTVTNPASPDYSPNVSVTNNQEADPGFTNAGVLGHLDSLIAYVRRIASRTLDNPWHYELNFPPKWPIPETFRYTNAALMTAGTDGLPLGDLNWFPELKPTDVKQTSDQIPTEYKLSDAYPNPFNPETKIDVSLTNTGNVRVYIYNILGQKVRTLVNEEMKAGSYTLTWNGKDDHGKQVVSGTYLYSLETENFKLTKKMVFLK